MKKNWILLLPILILIVAGSLLIKYAPVPYTSLVKPSFAPPAILFGIAWTIFYTIFYFTSTKVIHGSIKKNPLFQLYFLILGFHFIWILFFFTFRFYLISLFTLIVIYLLSVAYVFRMIKFSKKDALLNIPYLLWLLFALLLNLSILILN